jgi:hypothetical protein
MVIMWDLGDGTGRCPSITSSINSVWQTADNYYPVGFDETVKLASTSSATWQITGVQLEVGKNATEFEHRSYGEELALCQRYYQQSTGIGNNVGPWFLQVDGYGASLYRTTVSLPTMMRALPSVTWTAQGTIGATIGTQFITNHSFTPYTNTGSGSIHISSWTASAEL